MWDFKQALAAVKNLQAQGVIADYAIGGGISTIFYTEPVFTYDLDVFIVYEVPVPGLTGISGVSEFLRAQGCRWQGEHIVIGGVPVQFFVANDLESEAICHARLVKYEDIEIKIFSPEYLIAIMLRVGREKDLLRVKMLLEQTQVDKKQLTDILERYDLLEKYRQFL
jgi:hypothetical protein